MAHALLFGGRDAMSKKKSVHIIQSLFTGGAETLLCDLAEYCSTDFEVYVVTLYGENDELMVEKLKSAGVSLIFLDKKVGFHIKSLKNLFIILRKIKPDIIHTHLEAAVYALPYYLFYRKNVRIHTIHSRPEYEFTKYHIMAMKLAYRFLNVIPVAISGSIRDEAAKLYSLDKNGIPVIYNGVHTEKFKVLREKKEDFTEVRLINVASFSKIKNQALLLDALKLLRERTNARLTFVGDGETRDNTEKLAREYGFSEDTVSFLGLRRDIPDLLAKSDIFVLCSHYEGVPLSILEAYASGLPVVSTNVGGVPDILTNRENGLLVPPGSAEALADAVSEIMNPALYNKISEENLKKALEFDISRIAEQYITLYERDLR